MKRNAGSKKTVVKIAKQKRKQKQFGLMQGSSGLRRFDLCHWIKDQTQTAHDRQENGGYMWIKTG